MNSSNEQTVLGVFDDYRTAERAAQELTNAGISRNQIDVRSNFITGAAGRSTEAEEHREGGVSGFFRRLFHGDESDYAGHYSEAIRRGNSVVSVTAETGQVNRVVEILNSAGAVDIDEHVERYRKTGYGGYEEKAPAYTYDEAAAERERFNNEPGALPVVDEELEVGKRTVRRGGVRVHSRVVEEPVEETVELREEHVRVDRRPADRPLDARNELRDRTIEVVETAEEPVVQKRARVREEVVVGKETTSRTEKLRDKVKRTEVDVERLDPEKAGGTGTEWESGEHRPAYEYGYRSASDPRYAGRNWSDVEQDLRTDYLRKNPNSNWDRAKDAVRHGWEKVTSKR